MAESKTDVIVKSFKCTLGLPSTWLMPMPLGQQYDDIWCTYAPAPGEIFDGSIVTTYWYGIMPGKPVVSWPLYIKPDGTYVLLSSISTNEVPMAMDTEYKRATKLPITADGILGTIAVRYQGAIATRLQGTFTVSLQTKEV